MIDIVNEINAVHRATGSKTVATGEARTVVLRRSYTGEIEDVWDAITTPERIQRWFLPVTGDLRLGGNYQLVGNAGGEILECEPPRLLRVSWVFGESKDFSEVVVKLAPVADGKTELALEHTAIVDPDMWSQYGPGAVGIGWDMALLGLGLYLATGETVKEPETWPMSPEGRQFVTGCSQAWGAAHEASGASSADVANGVANSTQFYAPDGPPGQN
jgi:uncharacterized protein YndB with AHSA1/START domain